MKSKMSAYFNLRWRWFVYLPLSVLFLFIGSCNKDESGPGPGNGHIETDAFNEVLNAFVGLSGGTLTMPEGPLGGMTLEVPSKAYSSDKNFIISIADIKSHTFGIDFNPLTPMIRINNGGGYADSVLFLTVPCIVPKDHFAMGFYYDEESGELEGIPLVSNTDSSVMLVLRHFSGKHLNEGTGNLTTRARIWADILISSMQKDKLFELQESGFRPGIDDWEFPNNGSYIAPDGHCSGQSLTAMWYYSIHKMNRNEVPLYGRFSTVQGGIWQDNVNGYRFASAVQVDYKTLWKQENSMSRIFFDKFNEQGQKNRFAFDSLQYLGFAYSIRLTKKPQFVGVWSNAGGGHALIVYRTNGNVMSVADPNFPDRSSHFISLSNGAFLPYESKANANAPTQFYESINYYAKSALISSEGIAAHYEEMLGGTIGSGDPYFFPPVELLYYNGKEWLDLPDTLKTEMDTIILAARCLKCKLTNPSDLTAMVMLNSDGKFALKTDDKAYLTIPLQSGENPIPLEIFGSKSGQEWRYLDFKMPVIQKESLAGFGYWLGEVDDMGKIQSHFGYKTTSGMFPGKWNGLVYKVDYQKDYNIDGHEGTVYAKYTANCNASRSSINSYNIELWTEEGTTKGVIISLDGINLPLTSSEGANLVFSANNAGACGTLTRVDYFVAGKRANYGCDETSFVYFTIPKP